MNAPHCRADRGASPGARRRPGSCRRRLRGDWRARMARRARRLGRRRPGRGATRHALRRVRRRVLDPPAALRRCRAGSTICATAGGSCAEHTGSPSSPSASWRSAWPDRSPPSASSRRSCCGRCRIPSPDRVVTLWERQPSTPGRLDVAPGNFLDWRERATSFHSLAGAEPYSRDFSDGERPEVWRMLNVTEGFFESFGQPPLLGRTFAREEYSTRPPPGGRHQRQPVAIALRRRPGGGRAARSRSTANRGRSPA